MPDSHYGAATAPTFFDGLPPGELKEVLAELEHRRYDAGDVLIAEGDKPHEILIVQQGHAEVFVADRRGVEHRVGRIGPGASIGEMSIFTGQPASGTVRAATDVEVLILREPEFDQLADRHPLVYRNLGSILSERLARTNRLAVRNTTGHLTVLADRGAPPELPWALVSSIAWHTRAPTLLVVLGAEPHDDLARLAGNGTPGQDARAHLLSLPDVDSVRDRSLTHRVEDLFATYHHILLLTREPGTPQRDSARVVELDGVRLPALAPDDVDALREGLLPATTPAGVTLGGLARDLAGLKVGLALGAGSLRGYAHFGALHALGRLGVPIDYIAGTSVGALAAGTHAAGMSPAESIASFDRSGTYIFRPTLSLHGMLTSRPLGRYFRSVLGDRLIEELPMPLAVVAADLETQREVVFRSGSLWLALLASMSIPGIYPAMHVGGHTVADGGILNPVPSTVATEMGADVVVAVKLSGGAPPPQAVAEAVESAGRRPSSLNVLLRSVEIMYSRLATDLTDSTVVAIAPDLPDLPGAKLRNFTQGARYVEAGAEAVHEALPRLTAALPWLSARRA